jgi:hypothetical protein
LNGRALGGDMYGFVAVMKCRLGHVYSSYSITVIASGASNPWL